MQIQYNITVDDLKALKLRQFKKTNQSLVAIGIRFIVTMSLAFVELKAYDNYQNFGSFYFMAGTVFFGVAATLFFAFYYAIREYLFLKRFEKLCLSSAYQAILGYQTITLDEKAFKFTKDDFENEIKEPFIKQISEDEQMVYLQLDAQNAYLIPKRNFKDISELKHFHEIIKTFVLN